MKKAIVCGAGIGGLVSAICLAGKGYSVEIFEKNNFTGGKLKEFTRDGFRFDTGPALLIAPDIIKEFFQTTGRDLENYITLVKPEVSAKYFWSDGTIFSAFAENPELDAETRKVFGLAEAKNYKRYLESGDFFYKQLQDSFLNEDFKLRKYLARRGFKNFAKFISGWSINDLSNRFFKNKKLKQLFNWYSTYNGSSPYLAPQFFSSIAYAEHEFGAWYVSGGIYQLITALEKICGEMKININYDCELKKIETSGKKITKLYFNSKEEVTIAETDFDILVANFTNNLNLIGEDYFNNYDWSCSCFILIMGMSKKFSELSNHNVFFSENYEKEFIDVFEKKVPSDDMTIKISISNKIEGKDAPEGCENWLVCVNAPNLSNNLEWSDKVKIEYRNKIIDRIDSYSHLFECSIKNHIKFCEIVTPEDFLKTYNCEFGSLHGLSSNSIYTLIKRPRNKSKRFNNLYFVGGNTQPGAGVALSFLSGKLVAKLVE